MPNEEEQYEDEYQPEFIPEEQPQAEADPVGAEFFRMVSENHEAIPGTLHVIKREGLRLLRDYIPGQSLAQDTLAACVLSNALAESMDCYAEVVALRNKVIARINRGDNPESPQAILMRIAEIHTRV